MSFLGDLVNSIGTNKAPDLPKPAQRPSVISNAARSNSVPKPKPLPVSAAPPVSGLKRKLDERDSNVVKPIERIVKPNPVPSLTSSVHQRSGSLITNGVKPPVSRPTPNTMSANSQAPTKPPTKGSYAEMMARAKVAQQTRTPNPLGTIKHQASSKEKVSKLAERRRQEQEKLKAEKEKKPDKSAPNNRLDRKRATSPSKKAEQPKVPRAPRPPLHAPASSYKGTMGKSSKRPREERVPKRSRADEYLGTDEEDDSELDDYGDDDDGYGSDQSSDMEAGMDDIDNEEKLALRAAREDDAKELALESKLKREKEERKRRLEAMAKKGR